MSHARKRQAAKGQRISPGYSIPLEMCNTLYLIREKCKGNFSTLSYFQKNFKVYTTIHIIQRIHINMSLLTLHSFLFFNLQRICFQIQSCLTIPHLKYSSLGLTQVLLSVVIFNSLLKLPAAFADKQNVVFLMEVMFLSRRIQESVTQEKQTNKNHHREMWLKESRWWPF